MALTICSPGPLTTVQDRGRVGHAAEGYPECGACDRYALSLANLLCGNDENAAALEFTLAGPSLRTDTPVVVALAGLGAQAHIGERPLPLHTPALLLPGETLEIGALTDGLRGILAVSGGIDVPAVLGSRSTDLKCHIGGLHGRALQKGDELHVGRASRPAKAGIRALERAALRIGERPWACRPSSPRRWMDGRAFPVLRAVPGPQDDVFPPEACALLEREAYTVSPDSNRMASRLLGAPLPMKNGADILSDGIVEGSVQISANGLPIVMLADHQTTGGYAKLATVIPCDLPALAQVRPGERVGFRLISIEEGVAAMRLERKKLNWIKEQISYD